MFSLGIIKEIRRWGIERTSFITTITRYLLFIFTIFVATFIETIRRRPIALLLFLFDSCLSLGL